MLTKKPDAYCEVLTIDDRDTEDLLLLAIAKSERRKA